MTRNIKIKDGLIDNINETNDDVGEAYEMMFDDKLCGWAHSHTFGPALPSLTDIDNHKMSIDMIIYSVPGDVFNKFTPKELVELRKENNE